MARPRVHLAERAEAPPRVRRLGRGGPLRDPGCPRSRSQGLPVRRGAEGRHQAVGVQGVRHRLHARPPDRHLHGLLGGRLRRLLQLRPPRRTPPARRDARVSTGPDGERPAAPFIGGGAGRSARTEEEVLDAIEERRRRPRRKVLDEQITLSHGAVGKSSHDLVEALFLRELRNPLLEPLGDSAVIGNGEGRFAFTTDSFVVRPLFFPGGDIGELAVNGTVNDLAMAGARPIALSSGFIVEEGMPVADLDRIVSSMARAAEAAGVQVATGDTKVVERGKADALYINTSGVGAIEHSLELGPGSIRAGDRVIVSGSLGDHGMAIMIARGELALEVELESDTAPLNGIVGDLLAATDGVRSLRDPTRGGLATVLAELALSAQLGITIDEASLPIRPEVNGACEILGIDPLYVANEGKLVAIVAPEAEEDALAALRSHPLGADAVTVAEIRPEPPGLVLLETSFGGSRVVDMLAGDPLPRIC